MPRRRPTVPIAAVAVTALVALAGCTGGGADAPGTPVPTSGPGTGLIPSDDTTGDPVAGLPGCDAVADAAGDLLAGMAFNERFSSVALPAEDYPQRLCVFATADESAQIGITIAAIPLLDTEIEQYGTMPTVVEDERLGDGQVLQRTALVDDPEGPLTGSLLLFDSIVTVTVQGAAPGSSIPDALPQLTIPAATTALFEVRALLR